MALFPKFCCARAAATRLIRNAHLTHKPNAYYDYVACFVEGTNIQTNFGLVDVAEIRAGDHLVTLENGAQEVLCSGKSTVRGRGKLALICFEAGAMGNSQDLHSSPNHRVYVCNPMVRTLFRSERCFGCGEILVNGTTIKQLETDEITYFHILTAQNDVIFANGAPTETLFLGNSSRPALSSAAREELETLFPDLLKTTSKMTAAFLFLRAHEAYLFGASV